MIKKLDNNPNTAEEMDLHYEKLIKKGERINEWMFSYLEPYIPKTGNILEIGCGLGTTLMWIKERSQASLFGLDISRVAIDYCNNNLEGEYSCIRGEDWLEKETYDLIINSQTLEHVDDPIKIIMNMALSLKDGGVLFITVPWPNSNLDNGVFKHYWRFFPDDFRRLLGKVEIIQPDKNHMIVIWKK